MRLFKWLIAQASVLVVVLGLSLSGFGMAQAHTTMALDAPMPEHSGHADMEHAGHDMTSTDHGPAHEGHASCPMMGCCHTGGIGSQSVPTMTEFVACQLTRSFDLHLTNAEPESAKKPPRHV